MSRFTEITLGVFLLVATALPSSAQTPSTQLISLERALQLAATESETIAIAEAGVQQAEGERVRARSNLFPQINGSLSYSRTLASEFDDFFRTGGTGTETEEIDLPFGRSNIWQANLSLSQTIYNGGRTRALIDIAGASRKTAQANLRMARGQTEFEVARAYFDAAVADRLVRIAEETQGLARETLSYTEAGFRAGTQPEFEVLRAQVALDNQTPAVNRAKVNQQIAYLELKQLLDIPADETITVDASLDDPNLPVPQPFHLRFMEMASILSIGLTPDPAERSVVRAAESDVQRLEASLRSVEALGRPGIFADSSYSKVAYPSGFFSGLGDIHTNWTIGAVLNIPIFTGGRQRGDEMVARAQVAAQQAQYEDTQEIADLDTRSSWAELTAALSTWQAGLSTVQLARRAYQIAEVRYQNGISTQLEISDARLQLVRAEANHALAARNVQMARIRVALLPDLPVLQTAPAVQTPLDLPGLTGTEPLQEGF